MKLDIEEVKCACPYVIAGSTAALVAACFVPSVVLLGLEAAVAGGIYTYYRLSRASDKNSGDTVIVK